MAELIYHLPVIVILLPLSAALLCPILCKIKRGLGKAVTILSAGLNIVCAAGLFIRVLAEGKISYEMGGWPAPYGIEFSVDAINGILLIFVCTMGFLTMVYSHKPTQTMGDVSFMGFYALLSLLVTGLLGMTITGDIFNFYVFLEITSLAGYALISLGGIRGTVAAFRYLMLGTVGSSFYLLGAGVLYANTGTLNMAELAALTEEMFTGGTMVIVMVFFVIGFGIKMALFPLHGWLPEAHTFAHFAADPIIAGVMVKIPAFAMLRLFFFVFPREEYAVELTLTIIGFMGAAGMIYGSLKAMKQVDIRRVFAYSSIAQIGYIGVGYAIGNVYGLMGAVLHIINHGFMKGGLFFVAGAFKYKYGVTHIYKLGQIYRTNPLAVTGLVVFALSMVGLPPTAGFFSKWYLAMGAMEAGMYYMIGFLVLSSLLNAVYFFRILENIFMEEKQIEEPAVKEENGRLPKGELHFTMLLPIIVCALIICFMGLGNVAVVSVLKPALMGVGL